MVDNNPVKFQISQTIEKSKSIVNNFYEIQDVYPISFAKNRLEILMYGLLPWANSGIRKTIIINCNSITQDQITHEMAHFTLRKLSLGKSIPIWFDEGLACYISEMNFIGSEQQLRNAIQIKTVPDIMLWKGNEGKLMWLFQMYVNKNFTLIYGISYYMIIFLIKEFNKKKILEFISSLKSLNFEEAFVQSFGFSTQYFYHKFLKSIGVVNFTE